VDSGLEDCDAVVLEHVEELGGVSGWAEGGMLGEDRRTVVLPALSRPRKSSLACLFASPSWASMSQTVWKSVHQRVFLLIVESISWMRLAGGCMGGGGYQHTPVNDPHLVL